MRSNKLGPRGGARFADIQKNFTNKQLSLIGTVILAYNEAEEVLYKIFDSMVQFSGPTRAISSRLAVDAILDIIKIGVKQSNFDSTLCNMLNHSLGEEGFSQLKRYRDGVAHSRILDRATSVASFVTKKGDLVHVILSEKALSGLYDRLVSVIDELTEIKTIIELTIYLKSVDPSDAHNLARVE